MAQILIVDDEKGIRASLKAFLREDGHEVLTAENANEALCLMNENELDVVVSDIILPRITGVELLRKIHDSDPDIPVIMITGEPTVETATEGLRKGAFDYLIKPIHGNDIKKVVGNAARMKSLKDEKTRLEEENHRYQDHLEELVAERTKELQENEHKYRVLVEEARDGIYILQDSRFVYANDAFCGLFGYTREEIEGLDSFIELVEGESKEFMMKRNGSLKKSGADYSSHHEFVGRKKTGDKVYLEAKAVTIMYQGKPARQGVIRDITARKEHEQEMLNVVNNTSHLINTPLTVALGQMEMVKLGFKGVSPELADTIHDKLMLIRELVVDGLTKNLKLLTKETSDGLTPVKRRRVS